METKEKITKADSVKETRKSVATSNGMNATIYNTKGEKAGTIALPANLFGLSWNADLVHDVVTAMQANARHGNAHTKDRSEVRGGGKKPWQQKGTGRARHGSSRSPLWKGGGAHGPRNEKDFSRKINQKTRQKALLVTLSRKMKDNEIIFIDSLEMKTPKTAAALAVMKALTTIFPKLNKSKNAALIALPGTSEATQKSFRNLQCVTVAQMRNLNAVSILSNKYLVIVDPKTTIETLSRKQVVKETVETK